MMIMSTVIAIMCGMVFIIKDQKMIGNKNNGSNSITITFSHRMVITYEYKLSRGCNHICHVFGIVKVTKPSRIICRTFISMP